MSDQPKPALPATAPDSARQPSDSERAIAPAADPRVPPSPRHPISPSPHLPIAPSPPPPVSASPAHAEPVEVAPTSPSPTSPRKLAANRANARKSTGPRTSAGKARSSQNAVTHGLLVSSLKRLLAAATPDERESYTQVVQLLYEEVNPQGAREHLLVERLATAYLRQLRIHRVEAEVMAERLRDAAGRQSPLTHLPAHLEPILRYDVQADRAIQRALRELRRIQRDRRQAEAALDRELFGLLGHR